MSELTLEQKISECDVEVKNYIAALKIENKRLQKQIATIQAKLTTAENKIEILEPYEKRCHKIDSLTDAQLEEKMKELEEKVKTNQQ